MVVLIIFIIIIIIASAMLKHRKAKEIKVPQGLQIFNEREEVVLDVSDRITRVLDIVTLPFIQSNSYVYTNDAFIDHEPFVHFPVFNELINIPGWKPPVYSSFKGTDGNLGWNSTLNATYFQLTYTRLSSNSIKIENKFFYGPTHNSNKIYWFSTTPNIMRNVPLKVIIGVY